MMKTPGQELKTAREELGRSLSEMAETTRIGIQQLRGLEEDRYDSIPAPMYVRGFIKLYARKLGINSEPLVEKYEKIRKGEPLEPVEETPPPRPAAEKDFFSDPSTGLHPEMDRDLKDPAAAPPGRMPQRHWRESLPELPAFRLPEGITGKRILCGAAGVLLCSVLIFSLKSCGNGEENSQVEIPEVDDPHLRTPGPVYYQLPGSNQ